MTGTHLSHLRTGRRDNPSARLLAGLAELFGVPIGYFFDPTMEDKINSELGGTRPRCRDSEAKSLMLRAQGISPQSMEHLKGILERIREIEGLDDRGKDTRSRRRPERDLRLASSRAVRHGACLGDSR